MNFKNKNAGEIISKDAEISKNAARLIIENADTEAFFELCEKSEFIFDFIKEKIIKNLIEAVNKNNLQNIFNFTKIYNRDFEDVVVKSWVKFADEDLTDEILELLKNGTEAEKSYAASYFYYINDSLALEDLNKFALLEDENLAQNCAAALKQFGDKELFNKAIETIKNPEVDDFEKYKYVNFLVSYFDKSALETLFNYLESTCMKVFAASSILYLTGSLTELYKISPEHALKVFDILLTGYPEEITLDTVFDFGVFDFIKFLSKETEINANSYIERLLLKAKYKFNLISKEDIYTFDLTKQVKKEIGDISNFLNTINLDLFRNLASELGNDNRERVLEAFEVILNFGKKEFALKIAETIQKSPYEDVISEGLRVLKTFGEIQNYIEAGKINQEEILEKVSNETLKAVVKNYFA